MFNDQFYVIHQKGTKEYLNVDGEFGPFDFVEKFNNCALAEAIVKHYGPAYGVVGPVNEGEKR